MKCDELKVHKAYNRWIDEEMPTPNDDLICNEVYLKDEADKVIAELKEENESLKYSVATLETDLAMSQRWRKCSDEKPDEEQFVLAWLTEDGKRGFFLTSFFIGGKFLIGEDPHGCKPTYWMPLPSAPKEEK